MSINFLKKSMLSCVAVLSLVGMSDVMVQSVHADRTVYVSSSDEAIMGQMQNELSHGHNDVTSITLDNNGGVSYVKNNQQLSASPANLGHYDGIIDQIEAKMNEAGITKVTYANGSAVDQDGNPIDIEVSDNTTPIIPLPSPSNNTNANNTFNNGSNNQSNNKTANDKSKQNNNGNAKKDNKSSKKTSNKTLPAIKDTDKDPIESLQDAVSTVENITKKRTSFAKLQRQDLHKQQKLNADVKKIDKELKNKHLSKQAKKVLKVQRTNLNKQNNAMKAVNRLDKSLKNKHLSKTQRHALVIQRHDLNKQANNLAKLSKLDKELNSNHLTANKRHELITKRNHINKAIKLDAKLVKLNNKFYGKKLSHKNHAKMMKETKSLRHQIARLTK